MSFLDQIRRHIETILRVAFRENINRLLEFDPQGILAKVIRNPVLGTRGEAGSSAPVDPEILPGFTLGGFYGQPYDRDVPFDPDPGALWFKNGSLWEGHQYPDWESEFKYPPGIQVGNVFFENRNTNFVISWHWYSSDGPPGNAIKYLKTDTEFTAWLSSDQSSNNGGALSRDVLHEGRRLYHLPENFSCVGACWADDWLLMIGLNPSGPGVGGGWIYSGYSVDNNVNCAVSTVTNIYVLGNPLREPDLIFTPGTQIRIEGQTGQVSSTTGPLAANCYGIELVSPLGQAPTLGAPIELVKIPAFTGHTKIFAIQTVTNVDNELEIAPGEILYEIGELNRNDFTQQFIADPDGKNMVGLQYFDNGSTIDRDIHRFAFNTALTPPSVALSTESRNNSRDEIYIEHTQTTPSDSGCVEYFEDIWNNNIWDLDNLGPCVTCPEDPTTPWVAANSYYDGSIIESREYIQTNDRIERTIRTEDKIRTIAVDYDSAGNELEATLVIDYVSSVDSTTENKFLSDDSQTGQVVPVLSCVGGSLRTDITGTITRIYHDESSFKASHHLQSDFSIYIAVNGIKKVELGAFQDDILVDAVDSSRTGYYTVTETWEPTGVFTYGPPTIIGDPCSGQRGTGLVAPTSNLDLVSRVVDQGGTLFGFQCAFPDYNYFNWPMPDLNYDMRRTATPLLYIDLRSGIYVTQGREGAIDDIYQLPQSVSPNTQMYPYTVDSADFVPPTPVPNPEDYDKHWASWGVDFANEATVGSPTPTWVVMKAFRRKQQSDSNPINWKPLRDFIKTNEPESLVQGSAQNNNNYLIIVFVELPTVGQETLQVVQLRDPPEDPLSLINMPGVTKIRNIGVL